MRKSKVDEIFINHTIRRRFIIGYSVIICIFTLLSGILFYLNSINSKPVYAKYDEKSNIDYKVFLNQNDYYVKEYADKGNTYIASLIKHIETTFNYDLDLNKDNVDYRYKYYIDASVEVRDKNTKDIIFEKNEILKEEVINSDTGRTLNINESIKVDYNKYNNWISKFVNMFDLDNAYSTLKVNMYVNVSGACEANEVAENTNYSVMSLSIPLTTKTMSIEISDDLVNSSNNLLMCSNDVSYFYLLLALLAVSFDALMIFEFIKYLKKTRTAYDIYNKELKNILTNYKSYIQKVNASFDLKGYQPLPIDSFTDMLEIRDTVGQPILMVENSGKNGVYFIIPGDSKILYTYSLKVSDIRKQMKNKNKKKDDEIEGDK